MTAAVVLRGRLLCASTSIHAEQRVSCRQRGEQHQQKRSDTLLHGVSIADGTLETNRRHTTLPNFAEGNTVSPGFPDY